MSWLVGKSTHAHGYSQPSYRKIAEPGGPAEIADARELMIEYDLQPDRDGFRQPVFDVVARLPEDILDKKIADAISRLQGATRTLEMLWEEKNS